MRRLLSATRSDIIQRHGELGKHDDIDQRIPSIDREIDASDENRPANETDGSLWEPSDLDD